MAGLIASPELLNALHNKATQLRIHSVRATGRRERPSSSCASAERRRRIVFLRHALRSP